MHADVRLGFGVGTGIGRIAPERLAHTAENGFARPAIVRERVDHLILRRMKSDMRVTPFSIASFDAAYEKRTCWPSPGTRRPKWTSARTATPASCRSRLRNVSESAAPVILHASVTFGHA